MKKFNPYSDIKLQPSMSWIVPDSDPRIREICQPVKFPLTNDDVEYIKKMVSYVDASFYDQYKKFNITPGVAIAANQVGLLKRIIYFHFIDEDGFERHWLIANPEILSKSSDVSYLEYGEGCLSVPESRNGIVPRKSWIKFKAFDIIQEKNITLELSGYPAIVAQHELDHLDGILYYDHINVIDPQFTKKEWKKI